MRAHRIPWLSPTGASDNPWLTPTSPNLASDSPKAACRSQLSKEESEELQRPRHMSESYTSFDLPLASDEKLYDSYVNTSGGFREYINFSDHRRLICIGMGKLLERKLSTSNNNTKFCQTSIR
jgi:hypothetical protein